MEINKEFLQKNKKTIIIISVLILIISFVISYMIVSKKYKTSVLSKPDSKNIKKTVHLIILFDNQPRYGIMTFNNDNVESKMFITETDFLITDLSAKEANELIKKGNDDNTIIDLTLPTEDIIKRTKYTREQIMELKKKLK